MSVEQEPNVTYFHNKKVTDRVLPVRSIEMSIPPAYLVGILRF